MSPANVAAAACVGTLARDILAGPVVIDVADETRRYFDYLITIHGSLLARENARRRAR